MITHFVANYEWDPKFVLRNIGTAPLIIWTRHIFLILHLLRTFCSNQALRVTNKLSSSNTHTRPTTGAVVPPGALKWALQCMHCIAVYWSEHCTAHSIALQCTMPRGAVQALVHCCAAEEKRRSRGEREREPPLQWVSNLRGVTTTSPPPLPRNTSKSPTFEGSPSITTKKPNQAPDKPSHCSNFFFTLKNIRVAPVNINWKKILEKNIASNTLAAGKSSHTCLTIQVAI